MKMPWSPDKEQRRDLRGYRSGLNMCQTYTVAAHQNGPQLVIRDHGHFPPELGLPSVDFGSAFGRKNDAHASRTR